MRSTRATKLLSRISETLFRSGAILGELGPMVADAVKQILGKDAEPVYVTGMPDDEPRVNDIKAGETVGGDDLNAVSEVEIEGIKGAFINGKVKILFVDRKDADKLWGAKPNNNEEPEEEPEEPDAGGEE